MREACAPLLWTPPTGSHCRASLEGCGASQEGQLRECLWLTVSTHGSLSTYRRGAQASSRLCGDSAP